MAILQSTNYDEFKFVTGNREPNKGHVAALKRSFEENGNLTKVQPILVNEHMEIIDGQHRFVAAQELGLPIFYTVAEGLNVNDARTMNVLHRSWTGDDYAKSYAENGNENYVKYLEYREMYKLPYSVLLGVFVDSQANSKHRDFREGNFTIEDEDKAVEILEELSTIRSLVGGGIANKRPFVYAYLKARKMEGFKPDQLIKKLAFYGQPIQSFASVEDSGRQLEEIYNYKQTEGKRVRLF